MLNRVSNDVTENRQNYIGGSDIAVVMGVSRYKTPMMLWAEKTGVLEIEDISNLEHVELGTDLEQFVADTFTKRTGIKVRKAPNGYCHKDYSFMVAHIDRLVTGTDELLECKTCSAYKQDEWKDDGIPIEYIYQVQWYLGLTNKSKGYIACLIGGQKFVYKEIDFDKELFDSMIEKAKEFWSCVKTETPPTVAAADGDTLNKLYPTSNDTILETDNQDIEKQITLLEVVKQELKELEEKKKSLETSLKNAIKDNAGIKTTHYQVTWKNQTSNRFDSTRFKKENEDLYKQYTKETTTRVLRTKEV